MLRMVTGACLPSQFIVSVIETEVTVLTNSWSNSNVICSMKLRAKVPHKIYNQLLSDSV